MTSAPFVVSRNLTRSAKLGGGGLALASDSQTIAPVNRYLPGRVIARAGESSDCMVVVRATDEAGNTQPEVAPYNALGYLYGGVVGHPVEVL